MNDNCLVGIVTFNPEIDRFKRVLEQVSIQSNHLVVVDNGSRNFDQICACLESYESIKMISNKTNKGIATALNQIGDIAEQFDYAYFMTLDQDSIVDNDMIVKLLELFDDKSIGGVSPYIKINNQLTTNDVLEEIPTAISSGFIVRTSLWKQIGGFWEYLFIDEVDHEFCCQIRKHGYRIIRRNDISLDHCLGDSFTKVVFGHRFNPTNHSAFRRYYIARNNIILQHMYPDELFFKDRYKMLIRTMISIFICEDNKFKKIKSIISGINDGKKWCKRNDSIHNRRNESYQ